MAYELKDKIGHGAFGQVYLARSRKDPAQLYVIKKICLTGLKPVDQSNAFREAQLLSSLKHPNVCGCVDSFLEKDGSQDFLCIVMEYCAGGDLHTEIRNKRERNDRFSEAEIIDYLIQILMALQYIHDRKILHRDLKSKNLFLTKDKRVIKIGDFGIARILEHTMDMAETAVGTPYYLSPEVCQNKPYNYKSDVWSVGCILQELCFLKHPFDATNIYALLYKSKRILQDEVPPLPSTYSRELQELSKNMLQRNPELRPRVAEILALPFITTRIPSLIESLSSGADELATSPAHAPSEPPRSASRSRWGDDDAEAAGPDARGAPRGRGEGGAGRGPPAALGGGSAGGAARGAPPPRAPVPISDDSGDDEGSIPSGDDDDGSPPHRPAAPPPAPPPRPAGANSGGSGAGRVPAVPRPPPVRSALESDPHFKQREQKDLRDVAGILRESLRIETARQPAAPAPSSPLSLAEPEAGRIDMREAWSRKAAHLRAQCQAKLGPDFPRVFDLLQSRRTAQLKKNPTDDDALIRELDAICSGNEEKLHACNLVDQLILCQWRANS
eukprot:tig00000802_g4264.t1